jgi:hypothetical protein
LPEAERDDTFNRNIIDQPDYELSASDLVGQNVLIYRVNDSYYREADAWRAILGKKVFGMEAEMDVEERTPTTMFRISSLGTPLSADGKDTR